MPIGAFRLNTLSAAVSAAVSSITATGGDLVFYTKISGTTYKVHQFTTTGNNSFVVSSVSGTVPVDILLVGGGGAGGGATTTYGGGGGGGGGAVSYQTGLSVTAQTYTIAVGAGGTGVSGANGNAGSNTTGLGYTANGGGGGTVNSAATNGGASGANSTTSFTSTAGTYAYKGGNSFGSSTTTLRASGGGAGAGGAGVNAASATAGNAGLPLQNNIDGFNLYYASGGGGIGSTTGYAYSKYGALLVSTVTGSGGGSSTGSGGNSALISNTATYGGGGQGGHNSSTVATTGGNAAPGIAMIRYPVTGLTAPTSYSYFTSTTSSGATSPTWPASIQAGDIAILVNSVAASASGNQGIVPPGFINLTHSFTGGGGGMRTICSYKVLTGSETGSITTMGVSGTGNGSVLIIYRGNTVINGITLSSLNQETTTNAPANQTLTMTGVTGPYIGFAVYISNASITTRGSTTASSRELTASSGIYVKTFESTSSSVSFSDSTISMADYGTNSLQSFVLNVF